MRILRLLCAVALAGALGYSLATVAQETPKDRAFGGPGTAGGGFGGTWGDPNVVDGKRINYGETTQVKISVQPNTILTERMIESLLFSERVEHGAAIDIGGRPNPKNKTWAPVLELDGDSAALSVIWGGSNFQPDETIDHGVVFVQMGGGLSRTKTDLKKLDEDAARAKYDPIAKKFFAALRKRLEKELTAITRRQFDKEIERQRKSVEQELAFAEEAHERLAQRRQELQKLESGVPQQVLAESVANLQKHRQQLELDLAGMKGRAAALNEEVARTAQRVKKEPADDEVVRGLMRVIDHRMQQLRAVKELVDAGVPGGHSGNLAKAEEQVALAQVELAQAKRALSRTSAEQLEKLNADLTQLAIGTAETEAKLKYVKDQLKRDSELLRHETQRVQPAREKLAAETTAAQAMLAEAQRRQAELRRLEASFRPASVEVFSIEQELALETEPTGEKASANKP